MKFLISKQIFERFPSFVCGVIVAKNVNNKGINEEIFQLLKEEESKIRKEFNLENLSQVPFFSSWRKAYSSFGSEPSRFKCSSEALTRRVLKGESMKHINKLVDIYNYISLKYRTPVGGEDLSKIDGDIHLKFAEGNENFVSIESSEEETIPKGEVVYVNNRETLCRRWNWRESKKTKLTENTTSAFLVIDALSPLIGDDVKKAVDEFASLLKKFCDTDSKTFILNDKNIVIEW